MGHTDLTFDVVGVSPGAHPDPGLVAALGRAGALGILDMGARPDRCLASLEETARRCSGRFGVRLPEGAIVDLPSSAEVVMLPFGADQAPYADRAVLVEVTSLAEARAAVEAGAAGLVAKGAESGGRVSDQTAFVLLQEIVRDLDVPVWVRGGVGLHTSAACIAGGARGVVLDSQLALVRESSLPDPVKQAIRGMDGSETVLLAGHRVFARPDLPLTQRPGVTAEEVESSLGARDLVTQLLPVGQDAAFARGLAERFVTAGGVVSAIRRSIVEHLHTADALKPLAPESPLAASHGIEYPIAQGPMTRVSDRAAFADAVSQAGGMPFLALSLLRGPRCRALMERTAELLGERTWGVGILGFVPPELRDEQLAVIEEIRPKVAIIAGGRPSQARPLEAKGIATYLHVPSPGLLDLFLADGARRFVFEGRECGGHVGPRTSFALWEMQIERLLAFDRPEELHVLFAGGIHDERSAAMVAAMAAPLAERGVKIGVLMGTAYLFTQEAVSTGAIQQGFQDHAVRCDRTVLLETAPGHATRCVDSGYVAAFREARLRFEAEGRSPGETWEALEKLNLGRLRIAAKGVRREGDDLVRVDEQTQAREGMFMIGQVASMRDRTCTMAELHEQVSAGSARRLSAIAPQVAHAGREAPPPVDVAIVGMSGIFPGAPDLDTFWANVVAGVNSVTEVPRERWNPDVYFDPDSMDGNKTPSKWGGFLPEIPFDPLSYGMPPRSLSSIEPVQLLSLEVARRALADAGYAEREFDRERTSVIFGAEAGTDLSGAYGFRALYPQYAGEIPEALDDHLPSATEDSFPGILANVIAGRIANRLDLGGVNFTVDAACAASLAAVDMAVKELIDGTSDMVLCGGADLHNGINDYLMFASVHALSRKGQCRTFDAGADGIALGEGVACVVLKRLADAERDGDRVYAVIKGIAGSSDGKSLGLTAPRKEGQIRALERAYERAGVSPAQVGLVEAHGTGTVVGDRTELGTLTDVYSRAGAPLAGAGLGSVKSNIGHTKCAAGLAGLIKMALSIHHRVLPPTLHVEEPNPAYDASTSPFALSDKARPWLRAERNAAVSAFGFGGTNFHCVLSAWEGDTPPAAGLDEWPVELFLLRGEDRADALRLAARLERTLGGDDDQRLRDLARSVAAAGEGPVQIAIVAGSREALYDRLVAARNGQPMDDLFVRGEIEPGRVAFLFPGQGSQRPHMLADLFVTFPELQRHLRHEGAPVAEMFPPIACTPQERRAQNDAIRDTRVAQPALGVADLAMADLLASLGVRPDMAAGHSYGELAALAVAGAMTPQDLIGLSRARAECILEAAGDDPGTMAAVSATASEVGALLRDREGVVIANENAPSQTVISGTREAVEGAVAHLESLGLAARSIPVACAFHSPVVAGASARLASRLADVEVAEPSFPVWSNTTASPYPSDPARVKEIVAEHVSQPVRWTSQIEAMYEAGARVFVEVGPGRVLTGLVGRILGDRAHVAIATDEPGAAGLPRLLAAVAQLCTRTAVDVDPAALFRDRDAKVIDMDNPPRTQPPKSAWLVNGHRARPMHGEEPANGLRPTLAPVVGPASSQPPTPAPQGYGAAPGTREGAVIEYLRTMREMVAAQRDVMLGFLGAPPAMAVPVQPVQAIASTARSQRPVIAPPAPVPAEAIEIAAASVEPAAPKERVQDALLRIVSDKTGYPAEMLDLDLDLEAELSIDSIKRIEILGTLGKEMGFGDSADSDRDEIIEQLASRKTLRGILEWLDGRGLGDGAGPAPQVAAAPELAAEAPEPAPVEAPDAAPAQLPIQTRRYVLHVEEIGDAVANGVTLDGQRFVVTQDDGGLARALISRLDGCGAQARLYQPGEELGPVDGLIHLGALTSAGPEDPVKDLFELSRQAVLGGARWIVGVTALGGSFGRARDGARPPLRGAGVAGLLKSLKKELPDLRVRAIDIDPTEPVEDVTGKLVAELVAADDLVEVGHSGGVRHVLSVVPAEPSAGTPRDVELTRDSVVLITGGARGITARVAVELAQRYGCQLELVGRSPLPGAEDPELAGADDAPALRRLILARGGVREPRKVEGEVRRVLAAREIRATLGAIQAAGSDVVYHACDVRDPDAFGALIDDVYARNGRLDGVLHGAGVIEDKLLRHKTRESFDRVYDTKVAGARTLAAKIRDDVRFVVFFSSVSGAFGNRGQVDYAAGNDALDKLALDLNHRIPGRVVSINWGPWGGTGMVSPELESEYARKGIGLIAPDDGVERLVDEVQRGGEGQVILMAADPSTFS